MHFFTDKAKSPSFVLQSTFWNAIYQKLEKIRLTWKCQEHNTYCQTSSNLPIKSLTFAHDLSQYFKTSHKSKFLLYCIWSWPETLCHVLIINLEIPKINLNSFPTQLFWKDVCNKPNPSPVSKAFSTSQQSSISSQTARKTSANNAGITELRLFANSKR